MNAATLSPLFGYNLLDSPGAVGLPPWRLTAAALVQGYGAPDLSNAAVLLQEDTTHATHKIQQLFGPVAAGRVYDFICYCKAGARHRVALALWDHGAGQSGARAWFDLASGLPGSAYVSGDGAARLSWQMQAAGDGWYRCELTCQVSVTASTGMYTAQIWIAGQDGGLAYQGDGLSGILLWRPAVLHRRTVNFLRASDMVGFEPWTVINAAILDGIKDPDGGRAAVLLREAAVMGEHAAHQLIEHVVGGPHYSLSCVCKAAGRKTVRLVLRDAGSSGIGAEAWFDLSNGIAHHARTLGGNPGEPISQIEVVGDGWYRCILTDAVQTSSPGATYVAQIQIALDDGVAAYVGDGVAGVQIWHVRLQALALRGPRPMVEARESDVPADQSAAVPDDAAVIPEDNRPGEYFDPTDVSDRKLALLGALLAARRGPMHGVRLPVFAVPTRAGKPDRAVPFAQIFSRDALRAFAAQHGIRILPATRQDEPPGREDFNRAGHQIIHGDTDGFCKDFLGALRPLICDTEIAQRVRNAVFVERGVEVVVELRGELRWVRYLNNILPAHADAMEACDLSFMHVLRKIRATLSTRADSVFIVGGEDSLPFGKKAIRDAMAQDLGMALIWQSDLVSAAERQDLSCWDRALLDFEIAVSAPVFVGHSRSSFARLAALERHARIDAVVDSHYIYNVTGEGLGRRVDNGVQLAPTLTLAPSPGPEGASPGK